MRANRGVLEINTTGLRVDRKRMDQLTDLYMTVKAELKQKLREYLNWPELNPESHDQVCELLFGERFNNKQVLPGQLPTPLRPDGAYSLYLTPVMSNDKRPMRWEEVVERGLEDQKKPSTNKTALGILYRRPSTRSLPMKMVLSTRKTLASQ
jgi:hypothetical protein